MSNQEAISRIKEHIRVHKMGHYPHIQILEALMIAISALELQNEEPCSFCSRLEEENIECCIAGEDFIEPNYCPMCGRKLEGE